ncbi:hypothetical protein IE81DRAFT_2613 [Ceraceosorus guamensis]|uniref:Uncharacterized protein n=1 Tax=Ceraceosorus guamensis TaxID=1522189 RepID=A0A316W9S6_9BASI|nr:hypothetical protein IE81DRAFT_2613 [Ceraceosorus guamensis]PWN46274.1 hypothetical protein IE81DRAFT_2613 [Ceraceosorus guamensis]
MSRRNFSSELSLEELSLLHHYSVALVCYHQIEQQLRVRGLPFVHVRSASEISLPPASAAALRSTRSEVAKDSAHTSMVPSLCVRADSLLGASSSLVRRNVSIELRDWSDLLSCSVKFTVRLRRSLSTSSRKLVLNEATGDVLELESQQSALTFSTRSIDGCVALFLDAWDRVSRIMSLAREVASASRADKLDGLEVRSFDLQEVVFTYEGGLTASVSLQDDPQTPRGSSYRLQLASSAGTSQPNPHEVIIDSLSRMLNGRFDGAPTFWPSFLQLLHDTLPYLRVVAPIMDQCLEDVLAPEPDVRSATWLRLTFIDSFVLDVRLLRGSKVLILDGATPLEPSTELQGHESGSESLENSSIEKPQDQSSFARRRSNGASHSAALLDGAVSTPIPSFSEILQAVMREFRQRKRTTEAAEAEQQGSTADPKVRFAKPTIRHTSDPAVIDLESGLVCDAADHLVGPLLSAVIEKIKQRIASELGE